MMRSFANGGSGMAELFVDPEFRRLIPPMSAEERQQLELNLRNDGCHDPLIVWRNGKDTLLDGHNRLEICRRYGIAFQVQTVEIESRAHARLWIRLNQLGRRNLRDDQRAAIAHRVYAEAAALSRSERARKAGKTGGRNHPKLSSAAHVVLQAETASSKTSTSEGKLRTRAAVAEVARVSEKRLRNVAEIDKARPDFVDAIERGEKTIAQAKHEIRRADLVHKLESIEARQAKEIAGVYDLIVIDPPWPMEKIEPGKHPNHKRLDYPVMPLEEIEYEVDTRLKRHAAEDCHLFLWTTQKFLPAALGLLVKWDLNYVCTFVWRKTGGFQPFGLPQYNCEFVLYARKGSPEFVDTKAFPTCFEAPRGRHSEKPEEFYETLRRVTAGRRLDMFNRRKIAGFDGWGKEAP
jgi:N6-adenosine-specific RNA methylase IME4